MDLNFLKNDSKIGLSSIAREKYPLENGIKAPIVVDEESNTITFHLNKADHSTNSGMMLLDVFLSYVVRRKFTGLSNDESKEIEENILRIKEIARIALKRSERTNQSSYSRH